jgi:hypothetical protein
MQRRHHHFVCLFSEVSKRKKKAVIVSYIEARRDYNPDQSPPTTGYEPLVALNLRFTPHQRLKRNNNLTDR